MAQNQNAYTTATDTAIVHAPGGAIWIGTHQIDLNSDAQPPSPMNPLIFAASSSAGSANDPIIVSSDDDSAPPSQRASARTDAWAAYPNHTYIDMREPSSPVAQRILHGTPIATPIGTAASAIAGPAVGGPIPEIYIPQSLAMDAGHFAYAVLAAPVANPFAVIRAALENIRQVPPFTMAASSSGSALLVFHSRGDREFALTRSPFHHDSATVYLERPEDAENRATTTYNVLVELRALGYPLELWHGPGADFFFGHLGKLCCVDRCTFDAFDFTVL